MGSVIVGWKGTCPVRSTQEELIGFLDQVAQRSAEWIERTPPPLEPMGADVVFHLPAPNHPDKNSPPSLRSLIRRYDQEITGRILLDPELVIDQAGLREAVQQSKAPFVEIPPGKWQKKPSLYLAPARLRVYGIDFELFDPRRLYGDNRVSFVLLDSPDLPALSGCLAQIEGRDECRLYDSEHLSSSDWFVSESHIHLRYCMEEWSDSLLGWIKHFFVPDLQYWRREKLPRYQEISGTIESRCEQDGSDAAKRDFFADILAGFESEAEQWGSLCGAQAGEQDDEARDEGDD